MDRWKGKVAIVTGASAGMGVAIAEHLVNSGLKVAGIARRKELMDDLAKKLEGKSGQFYAVQTDIKNEHEVIETFKWITDNVGPINILINNAGIMRPNGLLNGKTEHWREIFDTNVLGLCVATKEAVKIMRVNNIDGHIVHINSIGGHTVPNFPHVNVYAASKHAVTALTETLRQELNSIGSKIKISSITPSYVKTELLQASGIEISPAFLDVINDSPGLKGEDIADAICYVLGTPPHVQVHELFIRPVGENF